MPAAAHILHFPFIVNFLNSSAYLTFLPSLSGGAHITRGSAASPITAAGDSGHRSADLRDKVYQFVSQRQSAAFFMQCLSPIHTCAQCPRHLKSCASRSFTAPLVRVLLFVCICLRHRSLLAAFMGIPQPTADYPMPALALPPPAVIPPIIHPVLPDAAVL